MTEDNKREQSVAPLKKDALIKLLKHLTELVENDDSLSDYIGYEAIEAMCGPSSINPLNASYIA